jgi:hypothetical protein
MKEKNLLKLQPLPKVKVPRVQATSIRSKQNKDFITGQKWKRRNYSNYNRSKKKIWCVDGKRRNLLLVKNEREETTQNIIVTKSAACASYKIKAIRNT